MKRVKLEPTAGDGAFLPIPPTILDVVGWKVGDEIEVKVFGITISLERVGPSPKDPLAALEP